MKPLVIKHIEAGEILDSRGNPTVQTTVLLSDGSTGVGIAPSGASTGKFEAHELRDEQQQRYGGLGVLKACSNVNVRIAEVLIGMDAQDQQAIDQAMIDRDATGNKSLLGANAILSVSLAVAHAVAAARKLPLYASIQETFGFKKERTYPLPIMNLINGGKHASTNIALQEFQIIPQADTPQKNIQMGSEVFHTLGEILQEHNLDTDVGNEGGYAPNVDSLEQIFEYIVQAITQAGYTPGTDIALGIDAAANSFYDEEKNVYMVAPPKQSVEMSGLSDLYKKWMSAYPLISIEDPFSEEAWDDWATFTKQVGSEALVIGDDLLVTNVERLKKGITHKAMNAILVKPNQIGTLSETIETIQYAQKHKITQIVSHRSGETGDTSIVDIAVAVGAGYLKAGAPSRGERVAKYNRLLALTKE